jgi:hypothetical protein
MRLSQLVTLGCVAALSACGATQAVDGGVGGGVVGGGSDAGCVTGDAVDLSTGAVSVLGELSGAADRTTPSCAATGLPDRVFEFELGAAEDLFVQVTSSTWQPVIALYPIDTCHAELACSAANLQGQTSLTGTGLAPGRYALVVDGHGVTRPDASRLEYELYVERPAVPPVTLTSGTPVSGIASHRGAWRYFALTLAGCAALTVTASGGTGDVDLYLGRAKPTTPRFLQRSTTTGDDESVTDASAAARRWIVGVYA